MLLVAISVFSSCECHFHCTVIVLGFMQYFICIKLFLMFIFANSSPAVKHKILKGILNFNYVFLKKVKRTKEPLDESERGE